MDTENPCKQHEDNELLIEALNRACYCISLDQDALRRELEKGFELRGLYRSILDSHPHLFSALPVFVSRQHVDGMVQIIHAIESVVAMPAYRDRVMQWSPEIAQFDPGPLGVFLSYDFHLGVHGPQLIEINTNAGGALLNTVLARAQRACCKEVEGLLVGPVDLALLEEKFFAMFAAEWRRQRGEQPLAAPGIAPHMPRTIAIVDDEPQGQYLYPEFLLFQQLFKRFGAEAVIADAKDLVFHDGRLHYKTLPVDLVYNRLTDFMLDKPEHAALRQSYLDGSVVVTPSPRSYALYADKRNLAVLSDQALLRSWGVADHIMAVLDNGIPHTFVVDPAQADDLWKARRGLFFKPATGFGGKAAYRGDKLTRRAWDDILGGRYIAQELVPPSERNIQDADVPLALKLDLRNYVYDGKVQLLAARMYQGQTTNFRTPGGGFSPVYYPL